MKKILFTLALAFSILTVASAQNAELNKYVGGKSLPESQSHAVSPVTKVINPNAYKAGEYLQLSARHQYYAIASFAVGGALVGFAPKGGESFEDVMYVVGGAAGVVGLFCGIKSIYYKNKAGNFLKLNATENGAALSYNF